MSKVSPWASGCSARAGCRSPTRSAWTAVYLPRLKQANLRALAEESGIRDNLLRKYRSGRTRPTAKQMQLLVACLRNAG